MFIGWRLPGFHRFDHDNVIREFLFQEMVNQLRSGKATRLGQPSPAMTGNGVPRVSFAPIGLKPRIWTFQITCYRMMSGHKIETSTPKSFFFFFEFCPDLAPPRTP